LGIREFRVVILIQMPQMSVHSLASPARVVIGDAMARDPVCGMTVSKENAPAKESYKGHTFYFCSEGCRAQFAKNPDRFATPAAMLM